MNHIELQALRHLLFFSVPEAALLVAASPDRPTGVQERTWRRWEDGTLSVPENIAEVMLSLADWREHAIDAVVELLCDEEAPEEFGWVWYSSLDQWMTLDGREPIMWRPHCAVAADAVALGARLVEFDSAGYAEWLNGRKDSEQMRGLWAARCS